jgi:thiol:disulfide interchange protein DsbD
MQTCRWRLLWLCLASVAAHALSGSAVSTDHVTARLVSETAAIGPGQTVWTALELEISDGWHTYWRNPGDSGQATSLKWNLPPGFTAGDIVWAAPHRFELPPLVNYGYSKHAVHLVPVTAPKTLPSGAPAVLEAKASWLVCSDVCVPEDAVLQLRLPASGSAAPADPSAAELFAAARAAAPAPSPAPASARVEKGQLVLTLGEAWGAALTQIESLEFFPYDEGIIEYAAPQALTRTKDALQLAIKTGDQPPRSGAVHGVLVAGELNGGKAVSLPIEIAAELVPAGAPGSAGAQGSAGAPARSLPSLILLAVLGGLILNLMPCVFPVLSIKAIGLVEQAKKHPAAVRAKGVVFALGVVGSMLSLALVLLALRAGGEQIGWGFQLQSPMFVTFMVYLLLGVGLNLSGVFEVGAGLAGIGDGLTRGDSYHAAFFTGVLTTLVATPCTAPFMAAAVGAALTQSAVIALVIFASLGLGLAFPYLLLSFAPWLRRSLPKPGAWMDTLKQIFAFPMYASAAWLLWVLAQQTSSLGLAAALAGTVLIALAAWSYQRSKSGAGLGHKAGVATAMISVALAVILPSRFAEVAAAHAGGGTASAAPLDEWQPYDAARLVELSAAGRPVLVNFTAAWCLTCLVNERNAFADGAVQEVFRRKNVILMKGDWTNRDPAIARALAAFGRGGVPLYLIYNAKPGSKEPVVLPQLLTANIVHDALSDLPDSK